MEDLIKLPFTQSHLLKAPEIVETIRKVGVVRVRSYKVGLDRCLCFVSSVRNLRARREYAKRRKNVFPSFFKCKQIRIFKKQELKS